MFRQAVHKQNYSKKKGHAPSGRSFSTVILRGIHHTATLNVIFVDIMNGKTINAKRTYTI